MSATNHSIGSGRLLTIGQAADYLSLSVVYVRLLSRQGKIPSVRYSAISHRRFRIEDLNRYMGKDESDETTATGKVCCLFRVSSSGQSRKSGENAKQSSLDNQKDLVREYVVKKYGQSVWDESVKFERVASGLRYDDETFVNLTKRILAGEFSKLIVKDKTRLMRYGWEMFEQICVAGNCEIEFSHPVVKESDDSMTELTNDLLSILTCFTSRISAKKAGDATRVDLPGELVRRTIKLARAGFSFRYIAELYKSEGLKSDKGKLYTRAILYRVVKSSSIISEIYNNRPQPGSFSSWFETHVRRGSDKLRLDHKTLVSKFYSYCDEHGWHKPSNNKISQILAKKEISHCQNKRNCKTWLGLSIVKCSK